MAPRWLDGLADVLARTDAPCYVVTETLAQRVTGFHVHRGALAALHRRPLPAVEEVLARAPARSRVAVLEDLVDHANVGAAFRNAAALGVDAVLTTPRCADPLYRRSIKVSMGAVFAVPWTRSGPWPEAVERLHEHGYTVVAMALGDASITLDALVAGDHDRLAFVFGTEGAGVSPRTLARSDVSVRIPMAPGVDSLNVAAATAVTFYATR